MNNLKALESLQQSAKQHSKELENTIREIYEQNAAVLNESLIATHQQKLNSLESSILKEIKGKQKLILTISLTVSIIFTAIATLAATTAYYKKWQVPTQLRFIGEQGERMIATKKYTYNKKTDTVYITIKE